MNTTERTKAMLALAQTTVTRLDRSGYQVESVALGNLRPVIRIAAPTNQPALSAIITRDSNGHTQRLCAACFHGCLVTWAAPASTEVLQ